VIYVIAIIIVFLEGKEVLLFLKYGNTREFSKIILGWRGFV